MVDYVMAMLEAEKVDPRKIQIHLTSFLGKKAATLMTELWTLLLDAQANGGVPKALIQEAKADLRRRRDEAIKVREEIANSEAKEAPQKSQPETWIPPPLDSMYDR